jgi:predicted small lipoprotein YifL
MKKFVIVAMLLSLVTLASCGEETKTPIEAPAVEAPAVEEDKKEESNKEA